MARVTGVLIIGYVLAAVLPLCGIIRLLVHARGVATDVLDRTRCTGSSTLTYGEVAKQFSDRARAPRARQLDVIWDLVLIGGGLAIGAATSITSLFVSTH